MRKEQAFALAAAGLLLTGCAKIEQESPKLSTDVATGTTELATEETSAAAQHPSVALQVPEITRQDVSMKLEAEDAAVPTGCSVAMMWSTLSGVRGSKYSRSPVSKSVETVSGLLLTMTASQPYFFSTQVQWTLQ